MPVKFNFEIVAWRQNPSFCSCCHVVVAEQEAFAGISVSPKNCPKPLQVFHRRLWICALAFSWCVPWNCWTGNGARRARAKVDVALWLVDFDWYQKERHPGHKGRKPTSAACSLLFCIKMCALHVTHSSFMRTYAWRREGFQTQPTEHEGSKAWLPLIARNCHFDVSISAKPFWIYWNLLGTVALWMLKSSSKRSGPVPSGALHDCSHFVIYCFLLKEGADSFEWSEFDLGSAKSKCGFHFTKI